MSVLNIVQRRIADQVRVAQERQTVIDTNAQAAALAAPAQTVLRRRQALRVSQAAPRPGLLAGAVTSTGLGG